jgi:hypothetical protein
MTEWKQDTMPKRMQESIKATRDKLKQQQREQIKKSAPTTAPVAKQQTAPDKPKVRSHRRRLPQPITFLNRVPAGRPALTHKRRRWLKKHPGVPVNQYPGVIVPERKMA